MPCLRCVRVYLYITNIYIYIYRYLNASSGVLGPLLYSLLSVLKYIYTHTHTHIHTCTHMYMYTDIAPLAAPRECVSRRRPERTRYYYLNVVINS